MNETTVHEFHLNRKLLIVITGSAQNSVSTLDEAHQVLWMNGLIDSHVLSQDVTRSWSLYTFLPYHDHCINLNNLKIETFTKLNFSSSMSLSIDRVYPEKLRDFNGCPLYIAPLIFRPFVWISNSTDQKYQFEGIDILILNEISKNLNFTPVYNYPLIKMENGKTRDRTAVECFDLVTLNSIAHLF